MNPWSMKTGIDKIYYSDCPKHYLCQTDIFLLLYLKEHIPDINYKFEKK